MRYRLLAFKPVRLPLIRSEPRQNSLATSRCDRYTALLITRAYYAGFIPRRHPVANLLLGTLATASPGFISSRRNYFWDLFTRFVNTPRHTPTTSLLLSTNSVSSRLDGPLRFRSVLSSSVPP